MAEKKNKDDTKSARPGLAALDRRINRKKYTLGRQTADAEKLMREEKMERAAAMAEAGRRHLNPKPAPEPEKKAEKKSEYKPPSRELLSKAPKPGGRAAREAAAKKGLEKAFPQEKPVPAPEKKPEPEKKAGEPKKVAGLAGHSRGASGTPTAGRMTLTKNPNIGVKMAKGRRRGPGGKERYA